MQFTGLAVRIMEPNVQRRRNMLESYKENSHSYAPVVCLVFSVFLHILAVHAPACVSVCVRFT